MSNVIAIGLGVLLLWIGYRLYVIDLDERAMDRHKEGVREGRIEHVQWRARMKEEALYHLYDVTEIQLDKIASRTPERTSYPQERPALPHPALNPEWDRFKKLGLD